uniref:Uncharacterized protein n=1 Tax=Meloidogyne enterolobii TaxID=390850 RepID=A0A6V7VPR2_MELEN|nr:unnamed protein product [Meloidogyne enterolobii]
MNIHLTIFIISVFVSNLLVLALERCDDKHGGYCIGEEGRGCCEHGHPLCCKAWHTDCIPRVGFNYNNTKCEKLDCLEGEVCMPLGEGKEKCVPKDVQVCNDYLKFEDKAKCGNNGYLIGYGLKYCNKFYQNYDSFNDHGKEFIKCVGPCLAEKMRINIEKYKENCDLLRNFAFNSHTPCYLKCNFTKFNVWFNNADIFVRIVDSKDIFSAETFRQMKNIILEEITEEFYSYFELLIRIYKRV